MKCKWISVVLCLSLVLLVGCSNAKKPSSEEITLSLDTVTAAPGETCTVNIWISDDLPVAAADLFVQFDQNMLTYGDFTVGKAFQGGMSDDGLVETGKVKITMATLSPPKEAGIIGSLTFTVSKQASGTLPLSLSYTTCCDYDTNDLKPVCKNGSIVVKE